MVRHRGRRRLQFSTYRYSGRDFRLTDVAGVVAKKIIA